MLFGTLFSPSRVFTPGNLSGQSLFCNLPFYTPERLLFHNKSQRKKKRNPEAGSGLEIHIPLVLNVLKLLLNQ